MPDLVETLNRETGFDWEWHRSRPAAVLFFGKPIVDGPRVRPSHCAIVFSGDEMGAWHVDVLRYATADPVRRPAQALRVPGEMSWIAMLEFVTLLVERLGGVDPAYQGSQT